VFRQGSVSGTGRIIKALADGYIVRPMLPGEDGFLAPAGEKVTVAKNDVTLLAQRWG